MDDGAVIAVASRVVGTELDGEFVMLDPDSGNYYGLNEVGSAVWRLIASPRRLDEVVAHVCATFEVAPDRCRADVEHLVSELANRQLVTVSE
jgi:hypothetical protein